MPSPYVTNLTKETGKPIEEVERLWKEAKQIASEEFGVPVSEFSKKEYRYTMGVLKNMVGMSEAKVIDPTIFLESQLSARDFLREAMTSGNFSIGNVRPPEDDEDDDEEDDDEEDDDEEDDDEEDDDEGLDRLSRNRYKGEELGEGAAVTAATQLISGDDEEDESWDDDDDEENLVGSRPEDLS
jgi:hypothetical protein